MDGEGCSLSRSVTFTSGRPFDFKTQNFQKMKQRKETKKLQKEIKSDISHNSTQTVSP